MPTDKIDTAAYKVSPQRPEEIAFRKPMIVLRGGQQLFFNTADVDWTFHTQYGRMKLEPKDLREVVLDTPDGGLHRAIFANESVLSGLLVTEKLSVSLDLGAKLSIPRYLIQRFAFPTGDYKGPDLAELTLVNEDILQGRVSDKVLEIDTDIEKVSVKRDEIAQITIPEEATLGRIRVKLHSGTMVEGKLVGKSIGFQIAPGAKLPVYVGHIVEMTCPKPPKKPTTQPAAKSKTKSGTAPAKKTPKTTPIPKRRLDTPDKRIGQLQDLIKKMQAEMAASKDQKRIAQLKAQIDRIQKQIAIERERDAKRANHTKVLKATAREAKLKRIREAQLQVQDRT